MKAMINPIFPAVLMSRLYSSAAQTQQYATLRHLLHKRQLLELEIWKSIQRIEGAKNNLAEVLEGVYVERLEGCLEVQTTGKVRQG